ncbi:MAG: hypothetical protein ACOYMN_21770 [Roseimicrobium sp.]
MFDELQFGQPVKAQAQASHHRNAGGRAIEKRVALGRNRDHVPSECLGLFARRLFSAMLKLRIANRAFVFDYCQMMQRAEHAH